MVVVVVVLALTAKYAQQGLRNGTVYVRLSVPARALSSKPVAVIWQAGDIDRWLHGWQSAAVNACSAMLLAYVGSRTQKC